MRTPTRVGSRAVVRAVLVPYVLSRVIVVATLETIRHIVTTDHLAVPLETHTGLLAWDAAWYRDIARAGYGGVASEGLRFFPLFPLLGRAVSWLPGASAGFGVLFVANVSALALGFALYQLVLNERDDADLARRAVWLVYLVPPTFVLVIGYAEATFMTFAALALLGLRSQRWWLAAICGFLAGLTRPVGVLLAVPAAVEGWQRKDAKAVIPAVAPAVGLFAYLLWAAHRTRDFWYPLRAQQDPVRRGHWVDPVHAVAHNVHELFAGDHVSAGIHALQRAGVRGPAGRARPPLAAVVHAVRGRRPRRCTEQPQSRLAGALRTRHDPVRAGRCRRDRRARPRASGALPGRRRTGRRVTSRVHRRAGAVNPA